MRHYLNRFHSTPLMNEAGEAGEGGGSPDTFAFDINGQKHEVPIALKETLIGFRDQHKGKSAELASQVESLTQRLEAIDREKAEQAESQRMKDLTGQQKWDEARAMLEEKHGGELAKIQNQKQALERLVIRSKLESVVAGEPSLRRYEDAEQQRTLVEDIVSQLAASVSFDAESNSLVVMKSDGSGPEMDVDGPKRVESLVARYLEARPHLKVAKHNPGSGAGGTKGGGSDTSNGGDNPFLSGNRTHQQQLMQKDPALAQRLASQAGVDISKLLAAIGAG